MRRLVVIGSVSCALASLVLSACQDRYCNRVALADDLECCVPATPGGLELPYDPDIALCCDGEVVERSGELNCDELPRCGGDILSDPDAQGCCPVLVGLSTPTPTVYNLAEATCCEFESGAGFVAGFLHYDPELDCSDTCFDVEGCCGRVTTPEDAFCCDADEERQSLFRSDTHACCGGAVVPAASYVDDAAFCLPTQCNGDPLLPGDGCCGATVHNLATQQCCELEGYEPFLVPVDGECTAPTRPLCGAIELAENETCCGDARTGIAYDPSAELCCPGTTPRVVAIDADCEETPPPVLCGGAPLPEGQTCCGDATVGTAYNAANGRCCISDGPPRVIGVDASCDDTPPPVLCGGTALPDGQTCCGNATVGSVYDATTTQCCDATTGETALLGEACESSTDLCGGATLPDGAACCGNVTTGSTYDPTTQQCCDPTTGRVASPSEPCTPGDSYSTWGFATPCGDHIYFSDYFRGIRRIDPTTLRVETFQIAGFALGSVCNGDELIYSDVDAGIFRAPLVGGDPTLLVGDADTRAYDLVLADGTLFWNRNEVTSDIWRYPLAGGSITTIAENQGYPLRLATDGTWIYWADRTDLAPRVRRARADGTSTEPELVMDGFLAYELLNEMTIVDGTIYVASRDLRVVSGPAVGGAPFTLISGTEGQPANIAVAGDYVYWRDDTNGAVRRRALDLSTPAETVATGPEFAGGPGDFVILDGTIYTFDSITYTVVRATP